MPALFPMSGIFRRRISPFRATPTWHPLWLASSSIPAQAGRITGTRLAGRGSHIEPSFSTLALTEILSVLMRRTKGVSIIRM